MRTESQVSREAAGLNLAWEKAAVPWKQEQSLISPFPPFFFLLTHACKLK